MSQKTIDFEVTTNFSFTYDPQSPEFQHLLRDYKCTFDRLADEEKLFKKIMKNLLMRGKQYGLITVLYADRGNGCKAELTGGITVENCDPEINFEIIKDPSYV